MSHRLKPFYGDLRLHFGSRWPLFVVFLLLAIFWPLAFFGPSLSLDPARFTEEWIKVGIGSLLVLILFEFMSHRRERRIVSRDESLFIVHYYITPLASLRVGMDELEAAVNSWVSGGSQPVFPRVVEFWKNFEANAALVENAPGLGTAAAITSILNKVNLSRTRNVIVSLQGLRDPADFNPSEFLEAKRSVDMLLSGLASLAKSRQADTLGEGYEG